MSRFWGGDSSSEEEERSVSSSDESEDQDIKKQTDRKFARAFVDDSDSDSDDDRRPVKAVKDRKWDAIHDLVVKLKNALKNRDWSAAHDQFGSVNKQVEKSKTLIAAHGVPGFYVKVLAELEDEVAAALKDKDAVKALKPAQSRSLNQLKLQVRKHNEGYRAKIDDFRANPGSYAEEEEQSSEESESDSDSSDSESSSSSSESETELTGRARWVKKAVRVSVKADEKPKDKDSAPSRPSVAAAASIKPVVFKPKEPKPVLSEAELDAKVAELVASRGRKASGQRDMVRQLEMLSKEARAFGIRKEIQVLVHLISAMFDSLRSIDDFMDLLQWNSCFRALLRVVTLLEAQPRLRLRPYTADEIANLGTVYEKVEQSSSAENSIPVAGSLDSFIAKLEEEYTKSVQQINPHTKEYVARLANEAALVELEEKIVDYFRRCGDQKAAATVSLLVVEHLYYKHDSHAKAVNQAHHFGKLFGAYSDLHPACKGHAASTEARDVQRCHPASFLGSPAVAAPPVDFSEKLEALCAFIFQYGDERMRTRALLASVFFHALHDRYYKARDLFLISHVQDFIEKAEVRTQILYNRTVVMLGLCAFRMGLFAKAHDSLSIICSGRTKELLAQGTTRSPDKDVEQEKLERRRQMPYHMHINPELLECCHLTCAMLLELPHLARGLATGASHAVVSRQLRKHLANYNKQAFVGPPESTREHVLAATKAVLSGDWSKACDLLLDLEVWNLIPGEGGAQVKQLLRARIQEEAIRCYLLLNGNSYDSLDLDTLCVMFDLEKTQVRKIICHMIFNREISASWENSGSVLNVHQVDPSSLQSSAVSISDKLAQFLESNERIVDSLVGVYGYKDDWNVRDKKQWVASSAADGSAMVRKGRHPGLKASHRPIVGKGGRGKSVRNRTDGNVNGGTNVWVQQKGRRGEESAESANLP